MNAKIHNSTFVGMIALNGASGVQELPLIMHTPLGAVTKFVSGMAVACLAINGFNSGSEWPRYCVPDDKVDALPALAAVPIYLGATALLTSITSKPISGIDAAEVLLGGVLATIVLKRNAKRNVRRVKSELKVIFS